MLSNLFYFLIVIGILVVIHEWGHFAAARLTGMRADVFSFGMGRRLFGWNKRTGFTFGNLPVDFEFDGLTDWRVCLFPIGGYVKVAGMIDESFDKDFVASEPNPWEFRSKNTLQKAFVLSAGVIMNFILAVAIYAGISYQNGRTTWDTTKIEYVKEGMVADLVGLRSGDEVHAVNGKKINTWNEFLHATSMDNFGGDFTIDIKRDDSNLTLNASSKDILDVLTDQDNLQRGLSSIIGADPFGVKVYVSQVLSTSPADKIGLRSNDTIISINNEYINSSNELIDIVARSDDSIMKIKWKRNDQIMNSIVRSDKNNKIGVILQMDYVGPSSHLDFTILESIQLGYQESINVINIIFKSFGQIFAGNLELKEAVAGPVMIAKQSGRTAEMGLDYFLTFLAGLSLSLALINILPFPALDGGHLIIVITEGIMRKELPIKAKLAIQNIGMLLLLVLMVLIVYIDITR